ncbi:aminoglycoside phosphotransferase family protein [Actinokineospora auranticolor]|uniref:Phosphotransferase family enzyme n=1 Tax=Actinokineospora auranticolor TaxID=155976 RepID=A0A2S6GRE8_9PSEU|nr:hypothetical protein [Actinokineospora auranticolor]PPK67776.1 hypothetical protein CLV40_1066 [Actinokineospora auranticolor]
MITGNALWGSGRWRGRALRWAADRLAANGWGPVRGVDAVRVRVWSVVFRLETARGFAWFKANGDGARFEAALYGVLRSVVPERVLEPVAVDERRGWLLLPDGGSGAAPLIDALPAYARLQIDLMPHVDRLLAAGVADMRPAALPGRFVEALGVVGDVPAEVAGLGPRIAEWAGELGAAPVPASVDHNDLHAGNALPDGRFHDWGDSVVAHPFASMLVPLTQAEPAARTRLVDAYLHPFGDFGTRPELRRQLDLACRLGRVARALVFHRAIRAAPGAYADAPRGHLVALVKPSFYD